MEVTATLNLEPFMGGYFAERETQVVEIHNTILNRRLVFIDPELVRKLRKESILLVGDKLGEIHLTNEQTEEGRLNPDILRLAINNRSVSKGNVRKMVLPGDYSVMGKYLLDMPFHIAIECFFEEYIDEHFSSQLCHDMAAIWINQTFYDLNAPGNNPTKVVFKQFAEKRLEYYLDNNRAFQSLANKRYYYSTKVLA